MIDTEKRTYKQLAKDKVRKRMNVQVDMDNYEYIPAKKPIDYYDSETPQNVGIYVRVSTDDIRQTTSYELQKKYYEDFVSRHSNWTLIDIYADEGISGTSLKHRDNFNRMIADAKAGRLDLIITKSVSRFARNVMITIGTTRELAELKHPVGVFFESECIFSLKDDSQMALSFQATMAEEESHTRSRSMEASLRMRLDNGIPLTPKLLGYTHDADGNLVINPEEAPTVKLAFYMYLFGYSTAQIADTLNALNRKSYLGNVNWTAGGVVQILRNERHCGDVLTRKTFTENYRTHRTLKNRGDRPQSHYRNHHEAIVSRDDFIAVQRLLDNARYKNKSILPELRVIEDGILKGFVSINPRWAGFTEADYYQACQSVYASDAEITGESSDGLTLNVSAGDIDLRGFEIARSELFDTVRQPFITFVDRTIKFSTPCIRKFGSKNFVELLINPIEKRLAVRPTNDSNRNGVYFSRATNGIFQPKDIPASAFIGKLFNIMGWKAENRYRIQGSLYEDGNELAYIFDGENTEVYLNSYVLASSVSDDDLDGSLRPLSQTKKRVRAIPEEWTEHFGKPFYLHEQTICSITNQEETDWKLRIEGQLYDTGHKINVTSFDELRSYITQEAASVIPLEDSL